jgi:hypothetical protein
VGIDPLKNTDAWKGVQLDEILLAEKTVFLMMIPPFKKHNFSLYRMIYLI